MGITIGIVLFIIAVLVGSWRQMNIVLESKARWEVAGYWQSPTNRKITWFIVALFSIVASYLFSAFIQQHIGKFIGQFCFGVILVIRWALSLMLSVIYLKDRDDIF